MTALAQSHNVIYNVKSQRYVYILLGSLSFHRRQWAHLDQGAPEPESEAMLGKLKQRKREWAREEDTVIISTILIFFLHVNLRARQTGQLLDWYRKLAATGDKRTSSEQHNQHQHHSPYPLLPSTHNYRIAGKFGGWQSILQPPN